MNAWFLRKSFQALKVYWYRRRPVFRGAFPSFAGIPYEGWFSGGEWRDKAIAQVQTARRDDPSFVPQSLSLSKAMLATVVGPLLNDSTPVRILDFGGAAGADYVNLRNALGPNARIQYLVVDEQSLISAGTDLFKDDPAISFTTTLPDQGHFDVVYSCSSLQYIDDYRSAFAKFASYEPKAMLFLRHCVARETFARQQMNRGSMPEWAYGLSEIETLFDQHGYRLVMKCYSEDEFNSDNYPTDLRIERSANLLFARW